MTKDNASLKHAEEILEADHYGLEKVKERMLEYLAVRILTKKGTSRSFAWWDRLEPVKLRSPARLRRRWDANMSA